MNRACLPAVQAFPSARRGAWRLLRPWLLALLMWPLLAWAAEIEVANPQLLPGDDGYVLTADFKFELNPRLEEAVTKGVVLHFVADFELSKGRWYWLDEAVVRLIEHAAANGWALGSPQFLAEMARQSGRPVRPRPRGRPRSPKPAA